MSQRTRAHRPALLCSKATGTRHRKCLAWEKAGLISFRQPVPDARSRDQRRFEAKIALVLAEALRDRQLDGALFGFHRVEPAPDGIGLYPHPAMANRVLRELLPRLDDEYYGELRGVPGLRPRWHQGTIILSDLMTTAQVYVIWPRRPPPVTADLESPGRALWRHGQMDAEEAVRRARWTGEAYDDPRRPFAAEAAARDWLLSRVLRRVALVNWEQALTASQTPTVTARTSSSSRAAGRTLRRSRGCCARAGWQYLRKTHCSKHLKHPRNSQVRSAWEATSE